MDFLVTMLVLGFAGSRIESHMGSMQTAKIVTLIWLFSVVICALSFMLFPKTSFLAGADFIRIGLTYSYGKFDVGSTMIIGCTVPYSWFPWLLILCYVFVNNCQFLPNVFGAIAGRITLAAIKE